MIKWISPGPFTPYMAVTPVLAGYCILLIVTLLSVLFSRTPHWMGGREFDWFLRCDAHI